MADEFDAPEEEVLPEDVVKALSAFGEFSAVKTTAGWVAMKCAPKPTYDRYHAMLYKEAERAQAQEFLAKACIIYANGVIADASDAKLGQVPCRAELAKMLERRPGIIGACANCALEATGVDSDATAKKYGAS